MHHFTPEMEDVEFNEVAKNYLMAAINSLNRLICADNFTHIKISNKLTPSINIRRVVWILLLFV